MRTKVLMTFFYIMLAIAALSLVVFIFAALQPGKYELALICSTVGYISMIIMLILLAIKKRWGKQDSDQKDK